MSGRKWFSRERQQIIFSVIQLTTIIKGSKRTVFLRKCKLSLKMPRNNVSVNCKGISWLEFL